jgi:hypothetical protein
MLKNEILQDVGMRWYHRHMTTATAQGFANIAFIKFTLAKLGRTNGTVCFGGYQVDETEC